MNRFFFTPSAENDLASIKSYLDQLPAKPALQIGLSLQRALVTIAAQPQLGSVHDDFSELFGGEVRTFLCGSYRIVYSSGSLLIQVLAILHTARDISTIMVSRLQ